MVLLLIIKTSYNVVCCQILYSLKFSKWIFIFGIQYSFNHTNIPQCPMAIDDATTCNLKLFKTKATIFTIVKPLLDEHWIEFTQSRLRKVTNNWSINCRKINEWYNSTFFCSYTVKREIIYIRENQRQSVWETFTFDSLVFNGT